MIKFKHCKKFTKNTLEDIKEFKTKIDLYRYVVSFIPSSVSECKIWVEKEKNGIKREWGTHIITVGTLGVVGFVDGWPVVN